MKGSNSISKNLRIAVITLAALGPQLSALADEIPCQAPRPGWIALRSVEDLELIRENPYGNYELLEHINFRNRSFRPIRSFAGVLEGCNRMIRGLKNLEPDEYGAALITENRGTIQNLRLNQFRIESSALRLAALVNRNAGRIKNVKLNSSELTGKREVAGIAVESVGGSLERVRVSNTILNGFTAAGLVGNSQNSAIHNSYFEGRIDIHGDKAGGLVALMRGGRISRSHAVGLIRASSERDCYVGGLVGRAGNEGNPPHFPSYELPFVKQSYASHLLSIESKCSAFPSGTGGLAGGGRVNILESFSNAAVTGDSAIGGLVGSFEDGRILNSYSRGDIVGQQLTGGIVGILYDGSIARSYSTSLVQGGEETGPLVGYQAPQRPGRLERSVVWNSTLNPHLVPDAQARTTSEMRSKETFETLTFRFPPWAMPVPGTRSWNSGFPILSFQEAQ